MTPRARHAELASRLNALVTQNRSRARPSLRAEVTLDLFAREQTPLPNTRAVLVIELDGFTVGMSRQLDGAWEVAVFLPGTMQGIASAFYWPGGTPSGWTGAVAHADRLRISHAIVRTVEDFAAEEAKR